MALMPEGPNLTDAGALPLVPDWRATIGGGFCPHHGQTVLVTGALGSVGRTAVHVAKQHGAYVIAAVRARQRAEAAELGADQIVAVDNEQEIAALKQLDAVADTIGRDVIDRLLP
jgi:NADPH:quinone reductase-like Zn-dependent oxidoreductase